MRFPNPLQGHRPLGTPAEHAGSSLAQGGLLSAVAIILLAVTALGLFARGAPPDATAMTWALSAAVPVGPLRELGRRVAYTPLQIGEALRLEAAADAIQPSLLAWL